MRYYYDTDRTRLLRFLAGALAGALVVGAVWVVQALLTPDERPAPRATMSSADRSQPTSAADSRTATPSPTTLDTCQAVFAAQAGPLDAGAPALAQWEVHIGAMNQLVTGVITIDQARAFWADTRTGAHRRLDQFHAASRDYAARTVRCPAPRSVHDDSQLKGCAAAVAARQHAVRTQRVTLGTWREHVRHMEMLRHGHMSPERAAELWLASWRAGVDEVRAHRAALREARGARC